jgi:hypothetical protein
VALENDVTTVGLHKDYLGKYRLKQSTYKRQNRTLILFGMINRKHQTTVFLNYLYEPNSAIMKSGGFDEVSHYYALNKLQNILIYILRQQFHSRKNFEIKNCIPYNKMK